MALNLTPSRRFGVALGVVLATVSTGLIGFAGTAGAHTNRSSAECVNDTTTLTVDLTAYNDQKTNKVTITDNGTVLHEGDFGKNYQETFDVPGDVEHIFTIAVVAWDDPVDEQNGNNWSFTDEHKVAACVQPPTETTTTEPPVETTTTEPPAPTSSEAPPAPTTPPTTTTTEVEEEALAETGASIALPLGIAGVLIVGGVGALLVVRRRSKA